MSKTDDLSAWRVFVTVARSGTLSAAAKALDVEVSSISRAIGGLEKALGCELIRRNMRPMKLTEAGQAALKRMETILRAHDGLMEALVNDNRALTGRVRLSSAPGFATRKLVPFIREFTEAHPGISVDIQTGGTEADVAKDRRALRREDVLARAARVNGGHALARGLDEKRLPCDVALDAKRGIRLAHGLDGRNAGGRPAGEVLAELAVAKARHDRCAVDGVEPEEFVLFHFQVLWGPRWTFPLPPRPSGCASYRRRP